MKPLFFFALVVLSCALPANEIVIQPHLGRFFAKAEVTRTFVLYHPLRNQTLVYNRERSKQRFRPASSFKVANAIIALDVGAVEDTEEVIPYGGTEEYFKSWEQDMTIIQAMKTSNVAVFHTIARRIGLDRYREILRAYQYGNGDPGTTIDNRFWLNGPLKISAMEQVEFFRKLTTDELPAKEEAIHSTKKMILFEQTEIRTIYAKTGWAGPDEPQIGWWVGWVDFGGTAFPFALNIDIRKNEDAPKRLTIGKACIHRSLGIE